VSQNGRDNQRLAALEREWCVFKSAVAQAQHEQQRQAALQYRAQLLEDSAAWSGRSSRSP
jgi:hypothetical protein